MESCRPMNDEIETSRDSDIVEENTHQNIMNRIESSAKKNKRFHCDYIGCNKKYNQKYRLEIHKRTHVTINY